MALSLKQFLLLILFICFAFSALINSERAFMLEIVKLVTFATLVAMAYGIWTNTGETRAYCAGFVLWGGLYYVLFVVMQAKRWDFGVENLLLWLGQFLDRMAPGQIIWAVYEKTGHLLLSILFGIVGGWVTVYFYHKRQKRLARRRQFTSRMNNGRSQRHPFMQRPEHNGTDSSNIGLASPLRLLLFAVLLPATVAGTNQLLLETFPSDWLQTWFYPSLVLSTAILSWCSGRYLQPAWFRWILFVWCLALLDLLTIVACMTGKLPDQFGYVLVSAQMSLLILWAVLGSEPWQWRVPAAGALFPFVFVFANSFARSSYVTEQSWNFMMLMAAPIIALLCGGLRYFGFVLTVALLDDHHEPQPGKRRTYQFGMKHMLIWFTVSGPLLLIIRSLDFGGRAFFPAALLATSVATVNLIAIWTVLGAGYWIIRVASLLAIPPLIALGMSSYSAYLKSTATGPWYQHYGTIAWAIGEMEDHWIAWLWLDAALLAALLLFLRASGLRLARNVAEARRAA